MSQKLIIGIVGEIASGKTTVTDYLKEHYQAVTFKFSDMLRDILKRMYLESSRPNLQTLSTILRQNFGDDVMSKVIMRDIQSSDARFIITEGIRRPSDAVYLRELPSFHIIAVSAEPAVRYDRLTKRRENPDDQQITWDQFQAQAGQESELKIADIAAQADYTVTNNATLPELFQQIDRIMNKVMSNE